jgi:glucose/arabinose dehydrogenase
MAFGPDGRFYVTVGSTCNDCAERDERNATMMRGEADGRNLSIFARGLRNTIGFDWHPVTGELWGMDHGSDWRGDEQPPEELNRLVAGAHYGWPFCWGDRQVDRMTAHEPPGTTKAAFCPGTVGPALTLAAHSAPLGMLFYRGSQFPAAYQGDAFVALHGSWNRNPVSGYKVVRIRFANGQPQGVEDFLTGFLAPSGDAQIGRPCGLAQEADGSLLVGDDTNGVIYRVQYVAGAH